MQSNVNLFILTTKDVPLTADATPANPKKGAKGGQRDMFRYERGFTARVCKRSVSGKQRSSLSVAARTVHVTFLPSYNH